MLKVCSALLSQLCSNNCDPKLGMTLKQWDAILREHFPLLE